MLEPWIIDNIKLLLNYRELMYGRNIERKKKKYILEDRSIKIC